MARSTVHQLPDDNLRHERLKLSTTNGIKLVDILRRAQRRRLSQGTRTSLQPRSSAGFGPATRLILDLYWVEANPPFM